MKTLFKQIVIAILAGIVAVIIAVILCYCVYLSAVTNTGVNIPFNML